MRRRVAIAPGQIARADPRSRALVENFAGQWLQLRNLQTVVRPGAPYSHAFDESLRQGMLRETQLFIDSIIRENRSLLEILTADYTFLNERVARHYDIPGVMGSQFRRVTLPLLMPGIIAGALLAFTLSLDDFVITFFVSGPGSTTLPIRVYSMIKFGVTPEVNAVSTLMFLGSALLVVFSLLLQRR